MTEGYARGGQSPRPTRLDPGGGDEGIAPLLAGLLKDLQDLVRGEVKLARTEIKEDLAGAGQGVAMLIAGALVGLTGFIFLMLAATYVLNLYVRMWIAAGIVALALLVIAAIVASVGKNRISGTAIKPNQTIDSLKEDQQWAKQQIKSVKK